MVQVLSIHYEHGTLKPAKVISRRGGGRGRVMEGMNQTRVLCTIYRNVTMKLPAQLICSNKNIKKEISKKNTITNKII
jgi:predicted DNA-binding antitoxin AbrB/MazE fold protein